MIYVTSENGQRIDNGIFSFEQGANTALEYNPFFINIGVSFKLGNRKTL